LPSCITSAAAQGFAFPQCIVPQARHAIGAGAPIDALQLEQKRGIAAVSNH